MKPRRIAVLGVTLLCALLAPAAVRSASYLPDTAVILRVGNRVTRVDAFVDAYFASYAVYRPKPDSLGRVEFLNSIIMKDVLGLMAQEVNRPLSFEDRLVLREFTDRVLSNTLFLRGVMDSVNVTEADIQEAHAAYGWEYHLRRIRFADQTTADSVRSALLARKARWADAVRRYSLDTDRHATEGDMGWIPRSSLDYDRATDIYALKPGGISSVTADRDGYHLFMLVERRKVKPLPLEPLRLILRSNIRSARAAVVADRLQKQVGREIGITYDAENIHFASAQFRGYQLMSQTSEGMVLDLSGNVPDFQPADTARVLAKHRDGRFTLGDFLHAYNDKPVPQRQPVGDPESFRSTLDAMVLEPYMAQLARTRGLESDSFAVVQIARKREEILVEHLFQDSVQSKVWIPAQERRKYYEDHIGQYTTYASVRFAAILRHSQAGADSVVARLKAGERPEAILRADSLQGFQSGSIQDRREDEKGPYQKFLFSELRPGQSTVVGPDKVGDWVAVQLISFDPGHPLSFEEADHYVDESLQNIRADEMLKALVARHQKRYKIEAHPELVMRILLTDPAVR
jgi:hypothetical protein